MRLPPEPSDLKEKRRKNMSTAADRQKQFKKGIDSEESRRRREDTTIQIRKTKKEERLNQRRRMVRRQLVFFRYLGLTRWIRFQKEMKMRVLDYLKRKLI